MEEGTAQSAPPMEDSPPSPGEVESAEPTRYAPWQILNERDRGEIIAHFLLGLSPFKISALTKRSLTFVYSVLRSPEAAQAIEEFENERAQGLTQVNARLQRSTVGLVDELLFIARQGSKESNRLKAIIEGLGMAGVSRIQKVQSVQTQITISMDKLKLAEQTIEMEREVGGGNGNSHSVNGKPILRELIESLNATGAGRVVVSDLFASGSIKSGLEDAQPEESLLPGSGGVGIRQDDGLLPPPNLPIRSGSEEETEAAGAAAWALQVDDCHESISDLVVGKRSSDPNPYYQRDSDKRTEVSH